MTLFENPKFYYVDGHRIAVYEYGSWSPEATVFLHGYLTWSYTWRRVIPLLKKQNYVIAIDLPGHGRSHNIRYDSTWSVEYIAHLLELLFDKMGVTQVNLAGTQMGGSIAAHYIAVQTSRVKRAVVIAAGALGETSKNLLLFRLLSSRVTGPLIKRMMSKKKFELKWAKAHGASYKRDSDSISEYYRHFQTLGTPMSIVALEVRRSFGKDFNRLAEPLSRCTVPTMLIWGGDDSVVPPVVGRRYRSLLEHSELYILEGTGDFPQEEDAQRVAELLDDHFSPTGGSSTLKR